MLVVEINVFLPHVWIKAKVTMGDVIVVRFHNMVQIVRKSWSRNEVKERDKESWSIRVA